jgi:hypothetical protein
VDNNIYATLYFRDNVIGFYKYLAVNHECGWYILN